MHVKTAIRALSLMGAAVTVLGCSPNEIGLDKQQRQYLDYLEKLERSELEPRWSDLGEQWDIVVADSTSSDQRLIVLADTILLLNDLLLDIATIDAESRDLRTIHPKLIRGLQLIHDALTQWLLALELNDIQTAEEASALWDEGVLLFNEYNSDLTRYCNEIGDESRNPVRPWTCR